MLAQDSPNPYSKALGVLLKLGIDRPMIVIVSSEHDEHARVVMERLHQLEAQVALLNLSDFPQAAQISISFDGSKSQGWYRRVDDKGSLDLEACDVVWWRRPQPFTIQPEIRVSEDRNFAYTECHSTFSGLWLTLDAFWINHPTREDEAARKIYQLKAAQALGLKIPTTCITNSPNQVRRFVDQVGSASTVYKAFSGTERAWRETRLLKPNEANLLDSVKYAPVIFQEYVPAEVDLRITIVGEQVFAAAIHSQETSYRVDFRMTMSEASVEAFELPEKVIRRLSNYMQHLGLIYGAIDMRLTPDGEYVFLEINPSGQWLFIEQRTGQPITESLVQLMLANNRNRSTGHRA